MPISGERDGLGQGNAATESSASARDGFSCCRAERDDDSAYDGESNPTGHEPAIHDSINMRNTTLAPIPVADPSDALGVQFVGVESAPPLGEYAQHSLQEVGHPPQSREPVLTPNSDTTSTPLTALVPGIILQRLMLIFAYINTDSQSVANFNATNGLHDPAGMAGDRNTPMSSRSSSELATTGNSVALAVSSSCNNRRMLTPWPTNDATARFSSTHPQNLAGGEGSAFDLVILGVSANNSRIESSSD